jgi:translocation and assembly module TamB
MRLSQLLRDRNNSEQPRTTQTARSWKKTFAWAMGISVALLLVIFGTLACVVRSAWFHNYALHKMEQEASAKLNTRVELQNYSIHLSKLSADLYGLTICGALPHNGPPLLLVQHASIGVRVISILHKRWYLDRLRIDDPVVQVFTNLQGVSNIPAISSSGGGSTFNIFQVGVRHVKLDHGKLYLDNKKSDFEADLQDLDFRSEFNKAQQEYSAAVSYRNGHLRVGSFQPISHELEAKFTATSNTFHLIDARLKSGKSQVRLKGTLKNYREPLLYATYDADLDGAEVAGTLNDPTIPAGTVHTKGFVTFRHGADRPLLDLLTINGDVRSRLVRLKTPKLYAQVSHISGNYTLANGNVTVQHLRARVLGGQLQASGNINDLTGDMQSKVTASLRGVSLAAAQMLLPASRATRDITLRGTMNGDANASWGKTFSNLSIQGNANIRGTIFKRHSASVLPVQSTIHGTYRAAGNQIALTRSYLKMPQTRLDMDGILSGRSNLTIQFQSRDLHELETLVSIVHPPTTGTATQALKLAGTATFQGIVRGSMANPKISGKLAAANIRFKGSTLPLIRSDMVLDRSLARVLHAQVEISPHVGQTSSSNRPKGTFPGRLQFDGSAGLSNWRFGNASPIQLQLHASNLDVATLLALAGSQAPVTGELGANINVHGTARDPIGHGDLAITRAKVYQESIQFIQATFIGSPDSVHADLSVNAHAGVIHTVLTYHPVEQSYQAKLRAANIHLNELHTLLAQNMNAKGLLSVKADARGTITNPALTATIQIPQLELMGQNIANIHLGLNVADRHLKALLKSQAVDTSIQAEANVDLFGGYMTSASLDTQPISFGPLLAMYAPSLGPDFSGLTEVHATLSGPIKQNDLMAAHIILPVLRVSYGKTIQLAATSPVRVDYSNGVVALQHTTIQGTDTNLQLQASVPIHGNVPVSALLLGNVNLQLAQLFDPDVRSSGDLVFNINSYGVRKDPNVQGEVKIVDANYSNGSLPLGLQHGNGTVFLTKNRINIKAFQGEVGGGTLTAQGGVSLRPAIQFDLGAAAKNIRMLYPQGLREEISANLRLAGNEKNALLGGAVRVDNVSFTPAFDLTRFIGNFSSGVTPPPTPGFSQNLHLNLAVNSTSGVNLVSRALSLNGTANLQVRGTAAEPVILGRINLNGGDVIFNGNRFVLNGGTVAFVNPTETQPVVNLALNTTIQQYNIHLRFNGPVDQLRTNYASDPSLPTADIINLLAFGQTTEANAANPATPGNEAAEGVLASQVSSQITSRVSKVAGISQLSINPVLSGGSTQGPAGAIVTVQQRVTGNFFVTFSTNVATTQDQVIMGQYQISPKVAVTGTRDQNGGFAFDTIFKKSW